jgi:hypothetical protein
VKKHNRSEYKFNIEVFQDKGNKEIKISNMPFDKLKLVVEELLKKYG